MTRQCIMGRVLSERRISHHGEHWRPRLIRRAQPFDAEGMRLSGQPVAIADELLYFEPLGSADFSVSRTGIVTYQLAASV